MTPEYFKYCPGTLAEGFNSYSQSCLRNLFDGKKVNPVLPCESPELNEKVAEAFMENRSRISISGVRVKLSLILEKNILRLTREGERGSYMLKLIPRDLKKVDQVPANEHLTMQIAKQAYGINTAENAMIFLKDGAPAYITKRFDVKKGGGKWGTEDFASLSGKTKDNAGADFKYAGSYEEAAALIKRYVPAWRVEMEKYFSLLVFNFLFSNGNAHLKNFSLMESSSGDYILSPAYDLINTRLHVDDSDFALSRGLFADDYKSKAYENNGCAGKTDFIELAKRTGISERRTQKLLARFLEKQPAVETLVERSFLSDADKQEYYSMYQTRLNSLREFRIKN